MPTRDCDLNIETGAVTQSAVDLFLPGRLPFFVVRRYSSADLADGAFGFGWGASFGLSLRFEGDRVLLGGGGRGNDEFPVPEDSAPVMEKSRSLTLAAGSIQLSNDRLYPAWTVTERNGKSWVFDGRSSPSGEHRLLSRRDLDGNEIRFIRDPSSGLLNRVVDSAGRQVDFRYDGNRVSQIDLSSRATGQRRPAFRRFRYDVHGDLVAVVDARGAATRYEYDRHHLVAVTNKAGGTAYFAYDQSGKAMYRWRADGSRYRQVLRDPVSHRIVVTNSFGRRWFYQCNDKDRIIRQVDPLRRVREHVYDGAGALVYSTLNVIGPPCVTRWDPIERVETVTCGGSETETRYNEFDKPLRIRDSRGYVWALEYDSRGHRVLQRFPTGAELRFAYAANGDLSEVEEPTGNRVAIRHTRTSSVLSDSLGPLEESTYDDLFHVALSLTSADGARATFEYDDADDLVRARWPDGSEDRWTYNAQGTPVEAVDALGARMIMGSDQYGRVVSAEDPNGHVYHVEWDAEDNLVAIQDPEGAVARFEYDGVSRLTTIAHFDGRQTAYEYDDLDRPARIYSPQTGTEARSEFDDLGQVARHASTNGPEWAFGYGSEGELLQASTADLTWSYEWDQECQLKREETPFRSVNHTHDLVGRRTSLEDDRGLRMDYEWDVRNRLTKLTITRKWVYEFRYNQRNLITDIRFPGGQILSLEYDAMARWTSRVLRAGDRVLIARRLRWDRGGNLIAMDDSRLGSFTYDVDPGGRLLGVRRDGITIERYEHDGQGNVLTTSDGEPIVLNGANRVVAAGARRFEFDGDGHLASRISENGTTYYNYDGDGFLRSVQLPDGTGIRYDYDALGRRFRRSVNGRTTIYHWDGESVQGEETDGESPVWYIFLPGSLIPLAIVKDGGVHTLLFNHIGTVTEAFDESGIVSWAADYTAFLAIRREEGSLTQPIRALGQFHDSEAGLYYNYYRFYDPVVSRYISPDPVHYENALNVYWYSSNPNDHVDPDGLGFVNGCLTLRPHCDWSDEQKADFQSKVEDLRAEIAGRKDKEIRVTASDAEKYDRDCDDAAKKWKDECKDQATADEKKREPKNTGDPCVDVDIDHRVEYALGGKDGCKNLTPRNASVNKSIGASIGRMMKKAKPYKPVKLTSIAVGPCRKKERDVAPCNKR